MLRAEPQARAAVAGPRRETWPEVLVVAAALVLLLAAYRDVVEGSAWLVTAALVTGLVTLSVVVLRLIGLRRVVTPLAVLVELVVLGWVFAPATLLVVVPTPDTVRVLADLVDRAGPIIVDEQAPVAAAQPVVLTVAAAFGALVVVADLLLRARFGAAAVGALLLAVYATPTMITGGDASLPLFLVVAALWLALLRLRTAIDGPSRRARQLPAMIAGGAALVGAALFPTVSPDISAVASSWGNAPPQVFGRGINPMIELGTNLRRNSPVTVLRYTTELDEPPYLKVATLTDFTGRTWKPEEADAEARFSRFEGRLEIDDDVEVEERSTTVSVDNLRSTLLPVPYPATAVDGFDGGLRWERTGQTVETVDGDSRGKTYTVKSLQITPTAEQLRAAPAAVSYDLRPFTEVPVPDDSADAYERIVSTADEVTQGESTTYDKVMALQDYLRSGAFTYSETAPVRDDYDGNGIDVLAEFLQRRAGYCVHFSSAMAVMARSLDIPSRIAVGYTPGTQGRFVDGEPTYSVQSDNLHAWTEVYFEGAGWVRFDPTPGVGEASSFEEEQVDTGGATGDTSSGTSTDDERTEDTGTDGVTPTSTPTEEASAGRSAVAVAVATVLVLALPWLVRAARRRWRLRPAAGADAAWREVEDTARDLGVATTPTETPRSFAGRLHHRAGVDAEAVDRLLVAVEQARYAREAEPSGTATDDARTVSGSLLAGATRAQRWRARLLPRSLAPRGAPQVATAPEPV